MTEVETLLYLIRNGNCYLTIHCKKCPMYPYTVCNSTNQGPRAKEFLYAKYGEEGVFEELL